DDPSAAARVVDLARGRGGQRSLHGSRRGEKVSTFAAHQRSGSASPERMPDAASEEVAGAEIDEAYHGAGRRTRRRHVQFAWTRNDHWRVALASEARQRGALHDRVVDARTGPR